MIHKSKKMRRKKSKDRSLLVDIALMACIHYALFLVYAFIWSSGKTHDTRRYNNHVTKVKLSSSSASIRAVTSKTSQASIKSNAGNSNKSPPSVDKKQRYIKYEPGKNLVYYLIKI